MTAKEYSSASGKPTIAIVVSVDWEGRSLLSENLDAIRSFRRDFSHVPLQHFLNAAYFLKGPGDHPRTCDFIAGSLARDDECGLHVHAWHSLVAESGVTFRNAPRFIDDREEVPKTSDDWSFFPAEEGYDVPLFAYDREEIGKIIATSRDILVHQGFNIDPSFRAGGWMSAPHVQHALVAQGMRFDCSPVDPGFAIRRFGDMPLCRWLGELWPNVSETSQPRLIEKDYGTLWEVPDNAALIDYATPREFQQTLRCNIDAARREGRDGLLVTGFHQETARIFLPQLAEALKCAEQVARGEGANLTFAARMEDIVDDRERRSGSSPASNRLDRGAQI